MAETGIRLSKSNALAAKVVYEALLVLKAHGGQLPGRQVTTEIEKRLEFDEYAKAQYENTKNIRWQSLLHLFTINCVKAGYLIKKKGTWYLTPEGEKALKQSKEELLLDIKKAYREWKGKQVEEQTEESDENNNDVSIFNSGTTTDQAEQIAKDGIKHFISKKNPYEFQELVAALLRGMGYYTPFVAPRGKDGGLDVLAYRDPFGIDSPRMKVQVKQRESSANVQEIRQLIGILQKDGDVGIFVSTGGFTSDAEFAARNAHVHVELIDIDKFIGLWQDFYKKLSDEDKNLMPLIPVYFLAPTE